MSHDALDNLRTWTQPGEGQRRYDYDGSNRLTVVRNAGGAAIIGLGYDVQGNLLIKNGQGYQFDFGNRLRVATSLERYRYDGHGRRSSVIDAGSGKNRHYLYSQGGALAYIWDQGTGERTQYIQLAGSLVAARKVAGSGAVSVRYQHTDALGSPVAETNEQAAVVLRTAYTPYGASIGAATDGVGYTGHVMDGSTGLTYMQQRYYDPIIGRFLSIDPITAYSNPVGAFNRYWYANNNPYKFTDPDGRQSWSNTGTANSWPAVQQACGGASSCEQEVAGNLAKAEAKMAFTAYGGSTVSGAIRALVAFFVRQPKSEQSNPSPGNTNPYDGPVDDAVTVVDSDGNAIPVNSGEQITGSPDGRYQQVRDSNGNPTGTRLDKGGHKAHADPKAQGPHGHRPGVTDDKGNPHLPLNEPKPPPEPKL